MSKHGNKKNQDRSNIEDQEQVRKNRIFGRTGVYLMDEKNSIDIDTKSDFEQAKKILNRGK